MIVTIDGPAGAGKSTVARIVAGRLSLPYLNSGYIYRAITVLALERSVPFDDEARILRLIEEADLRFVDDPEAEDPLLRTRVLSGDDELTGRLKAPEVTREVWRVANHGPYRVALEETQRLCARARDGAPGGLVAEGRDMGSVIFPQADAKFFLDASAEERARRQHAEAVSGQVESGGAVPSYEDILRSIEERDARDYGRQDAPLKVPDGGVVVNTDGLSVDQVVERLLSHVKAGPRRSDSGGSPGGPLR